MTIRVGIADDQTLVRAGFRVLIESAPEMSVVWEATTGRQAVRLAESMPVDVILMDIRMPKLDGIEATRQIGARASLEATRVLILTTYETDDHVAQAIRAGASGFLLKDAEPDELLGAIRVVNQGEALLSPSVTRRLIAAFVASSAVKPAPAPPADLQELTDREREVLQLVGQGLNNVEIADLLSVSVATAKTHISRILAKLDARDRTQLVVIAYESGLVEPGKPTDRA